MIEYLYAALAAPLSFFFWATIHEAAHLVVLRPDRYRMYPYPHWRNGSFYWARVETWGAEWTPVALLAPRIPDAIAAVAFMFVASAPPWAWVLVGGGLVDLLVGSIGWSERSDLRRAAALLDISPWWLRGGGVVVAGSSAAWLF